MKIHLLGTTGYHPNDRRHTPCLLLPSCGVMLDAGTATFRVGPLLETPELDIFLTHAHLDHVIGLTFLFSVMRVHPLKQIRVHALPEKLEAIDRHLFAEALFPKRPPMTFCPLDGKVVLADGGSVSYFSLEHRGGSLGYRIDWPGCSMAYVTDTTASADAPYVAKIRGVDLLIHECDYPDSQAALADQLGHSHTTPVAQVALAAQVKRLVLTHFDPLSTAADPVGLATAQAIFPNTILAEDRMELSF